MDGSIKISRKVYNSEMYLAEPFTKFQAWLDLLLSAAHKPTVIEIKGKKIKLERGQCAVSQLTMAKRWQWSRGKVRRFLGSLETVQQIEQQTVQQAVQLTTLVTICNYNKYQAVEDEYGTTIGTTGGTKGGPQTIHNNGFCVPSVSELRDYMVERGWPLDFAHVESQSFFDHFEANGWELKSGKKMKSWRGAVGTWMKNCKTIPERRPTRHFDEVIREL